MKELDVEDFITGVGFQSISDYVFSKTIANNKKELLKSPTFYLLNYSGNKNSETVLLRNKNIALHENSLIFTHSELINNLFENIKKVNGFGNFTVISHMSDKIINKNILKKIPNQVKRLYVINSNVDSNKISNIPLGLGNEYSKKNIHKNDLSYLYLSNFYKEEISMYLNFNLNTNYKIRSPLYDKFRIYNWVNVENHSLDKLKYVDDLKNSTFVLCPPGNGPDTHRVWEALYSGSIPIVLDTPTFNSYNDLPIMRVKSFNDITYERLENYLISIKNNKDLSLSKLSLNWWRNHLINEINLKNQYCKETSTYELKNLEINLKINLKANNLKKLIKRFNHKISQIVNGSGK